jgi:hypothetical protein
MMDFVVLIQELVLEPMSPVENGLKNNKSGQQFAARQSAIERQTIDEFGLPQSPLQQKSKALNVPVSGIGSRTKERSVHQYHSH